MTPSGRIKYQLHQSEHRTLAGGGPADVRRNMSWKCIGFKLETRYCTQKPLWCELQPWSDYFGSSNLILAEELKKKKSWTINGDHHFFFFFFFSRSSSIFASWRNRAEADGGNLMSLKNWTNWNQDVEKILQFQQFIWLRYGVMWTGD